MKNIKQKGKKFVCVMLPSIRELLCKLEDSIEELLGQETCMCLQPLHLQHLCICSRHLPFRTQSVLQVHFLHKHACEEIVSQRHSVEYALESGVDETNVPSVFQACEAEERVSSATRGEKAVWETDVVLVDWWERRALDCVDGVDFSVWLATTY
jgi:hypothetical protein